MDNIHFMDNLIELFCKRNSITKPSDNKDVESLMNRMKAIGLITDKEIQEYKESKKKT